MSDEGIRLHNDQLPQVARLVVEAMRDDIKEILHASARAPAIPPPNKPPIDFDGLDARQILALKNDLLTEVREEIGRAFDKRMLDLRTEAQILALIDGRLRRVHMRTDDEHYEETAEDMREVRTWTKRVRRVTAGIALAILTAMLGALLKLAGINLPAIEPH